MKDRLLCHPDRGSERNERPSRGILYRTVTRSEHGKKSLFTDTHRARPIRLRGSAQPHRSAQGDMDNGRAASFSIEMTGKRKDAFYVILNFTFYILHFTFYIRKIPIRLCGQDRITPHVRRGIERCVLGEAVVHAAQARLPYAARTQRTMAAVSSASTRAMTPI